MLKLGIDPEKLYLATFIRQYGLCCCNMALVSFQLFCKNVGHLREFFWANGLPPFPVRLCIQIHKDTYQAHTPYAQTTDIWAIYSSKISLVRRSITRPSTRGIFFQQFSEKTNQELSAVPSCELSRLLENLELRYAFNTLAAVTPDRTPYPKLRNAFGVNRRETFWRTLCWDTDFEGIDKQDLAVELCLIFFCAAMTSLTRAKTE